MSCENSYIDNATRASFKCQLYTEMASGGHFNLVSAAGEAQEVGDVVHPTV